MNDQTYLLRQNERLFEATLDEFSSKPYALASTNEIIKNAEYNKGSFYYRFKTKEEIYVALIDYVYVKQIALFEQQHLRINTLNSVSEVIMILFENLRELHKLDKRYVLLLRKIQLESKGLKDYIKQYCISSFLERILKQMKILLETLYDPVESKIFIDFLLYSYHNDDTVFMKKEFNSYISNITKFLTNKTVRNKTEFQSHIDWSTLKSSLNYVLMLEQHFKKEHLDDICYLSDIINDLEFLKTMRKTLKIQKIDLENVLKSGLKRNLKDYTHLMKLSGLSYFSTSYHQLELDQKIVLIITYFVLIGKETIFIDYLLKFINFNDIEILFQDLLPILSKTSTIILLEEEFYLLPVVIGQMYHYDKDNSLELIDFEQTQVQDKNTYEIQYLDTDNRIKTIQKSQSDIHMEDYYKYRFITLNAIHKIRVQDIIVRSTL